MHAKVALAKVAASLQEGAELRVKVAHDNAHAIVEAAMKTHNVNPEKVNPAIS